jgi:hypothetical protein
MIKKGDRIAQGVADYIPRVATKEVNVDTVAALNSKVAEVSLKDAITAADATASKFAVKDAAGKEVNVQKAIRAAFVSIRALAESTHKTNEEMTSDVIEDFMRGLSNKKH